MEFKIEEKKGYITCMLSVDGVADVCKCKIYFNDEADTLVISAWYTKDKFKNRGLGKETMKYTLHYCIKKYGKPASIKYIWNGTNEYVLDWLTKHFNAVCICPLAVQKNQTEDDWYSHIYELDSDKVLEYFGLQ